jgi:hypothetical protein
MFPVYGEKCLSRIAVHNWVEKKPPWWQTFRWLRRGWNGGAEVAETTVKILLCCGFRRTGKAMEQVYQCWWMLCWEINVIFSGSNNTFFTFYIILWPIYWLSLLYSLSEILEASLNKPPPTSTPSWRRAWYFISFREVGWDSLVGTSATIWPIVPAPDDRWVWSSQWNGNWQGKSEYTEKTGPQCHFVHHKSHTWLDLGSNTGHRRGGKPATNRLRHSCLIKQRQFKLSTDVTNAVNHYVHLSTPRQQFPSIRKISTDRHVRALLQCQFKTRNVTGCGTYRSRAD